MKMIFANPPEDHGFMYQRTLLDPDGHAWEPFWMDPAVANGEQPVETSKGNQPVVTLGE